jgi:hypothetical protein
MNIDEIVVVTPFTVTTHGGAGVAAFNVSRPCRCFRRNITPDTGIPTYNWIVVDSNGQIVDESIPAGQGAQSWNDNISPMGGDLTFRIMGASNDTTFTVALWGY